MWQPDRVASYGWWPKFLLDYLYTVAREGNCVSSESEISMDNIALARDYLLSQERPDDGATPTS